LFVLTSTPSPILPKKEKLQFKNMNKEITFGNLLNPDINKEFKIEPKFGSV
jgi:hypothetical protein